MKQHLRFMSLVLLVLTLLAVVGCSEGNSPATTATTLAKPTDTVPGTTATIPMQTTQPATVPTTIPVAPTTVPTVPTTVPSDEEDPEGRLAVVFLIDTSASVGADRLDATIEAVKAYVNALNDGDYCGFTTLAPRRGETITLLPASEKESALQEIENIAEGGVEGGTIFSGAILDAGNALAEIENVERKHIVLITDGNPGDIYEVYVEYIEQNVKNQITMSVVMMDVNDLCLREQMQIVADAGGGRCYDVQKEDYDRVSEIILDDLAEIRKEMLETP